MLHKVCTVNTQEPTAPQSLPKYLAEGIPKQDDETLEDIREYVTDLLEYRDQAVASEDLPDDANPVEDTPDDSTESQDGTIVEQTVTCGDESCHCADGEPHGPYLYRYYYADGTLNSEYLGKPQDDET